MAAAKRMQMYCYILKIGYHKNEKILVIFSGKHVFLITSLKIIAFAVF